MNTHECLRSSFRKKVRVRQTTTSERSRPTMKKRQRARTAAAPSERKMPLPSFGKDGASFYDNTTGASNRDTDGERSSCQHPNKEPRTNSGAKSGSRKRLLPVSVLGVLLAASTGEAHDPLPPRPYQQIEESSPTMLNFSEQEWMSARWSPDLAGDDSSSLVSRRLQTEQQCTLAIAIRDSNRDDQLSQTEYVTFLNQLFGNQYASSTFLSLPCELQETFSEYADSGTNTINVEGTKPGQTPSAEESQRISDMCTQIIAIVDSNPPDGPCTDSSPVVGAPVAAPTGGGGAGEVDCTGTIQRSQCNTALAIADLSRDDQMDPSEYVRFVNRLSSNAYQGATFDALPGNIQSTFEKFATDASVVDVTGSKPGQTPTAAQDVMLDALCCETDLAIQNPGLPVSSPTKAPSENAGGEGPDCSGTISQAQCNTAIAIADLSRDDLMDESEYVRFINRLSNNEYSGVEFDALPAGLKSNYDKFAVTNGQIDVTGSKPGQTPTSAQADFLAALCCETDLTIDNPGEGGDGPTGAPQPSPPVASSPPTYLPQVCRTAMASSDFNRDDNLNQDEYVRFLNRLTQNQYSGSAFADLSPELQNNFESNAQSGEINIFGSKPGQSPSTAQSEFLDEFCVDTAIAIQAGGSGGTPPSASPGGGGTPTAQPQGGGDGPPTFSDALCRTAMATSDQNRDAYLNQEEYVLFLNRLTLDQFEGATFATLESPLPQTYDKLSDETGQIPIFGAMPGQDATQEQEDFLLEICYEVSVAVDQLGGTQAPAGTPPPGSPPPTLPPGVAEVYSSFIISNIRGLTALDLETGPDRQGLDTAYGEFAKQTVDSLSQARRLLQQQLRHRRLAVSFITRTDEIYLLLDDDCPEGLDDTETCQTAFAKFQVKLDEEDAQKITDEYSAAGQKSIADGILQDILTAEDPRNGLRIVDASFPLTSTLPPTAAPLQTEAPQPTGGGGGKGKGDDDGGGGGNAGAIVGGIFGGIAFCAFIGWASSKFGKKKGKKGLDDDDDKMGEGDDDASDGEKENAFGFGGDKDEDNKPEQAQDTKNVFGFGKKNKQNDDDNAFGIDAAQTNGTFGDDDNMELFAFDEPSVARENGDGQDGSVAEKDNAFGATDSGWGNTANGAGGFFGNDGGGDWGGKEKGGNDDFFGNSGFGEAGPKESSGSGSGSRSRSDSGSEEGSYTSSEDSTYESGNPEEEGEEGEDGDGDEGSGSYSRSSADEGSSYASGSRGSGQVDDDGNWDGIAAGADSFAGSSLAGSSKRSSRKDNKSVTDSDVEDDEDSFSGSESGSGSASGSATTATTMTEDREKRAEYHAQVDALVRLVLPDEVEKVDAMMEQFKGREAELVSTLQTMQERSATQRARAAVHKSKNRPQRGEDGAFALSSALAGGAEGAAAGTAAIAAASLPIPAEGMFDEGEGDFGDDQGQMGFGNEGAFGGADEPFEEGEEEGSYYDDEEGSRSHSGSGSASRSYYSNEGSRSRGSQSGSRSGSRSYYSEEGSRSRYSDEGSQVSRSQGSRSYYSGEDSRSGSGSRSGSRSGSHSGSRSGSRSGSHSGSRRRSQYSGEEGSRSQYSGEEGSPGSQGSRSYYSGEEGSQGSRSDYSGEERSQEGSRSNYSGEGSQSQGSKSYYSGEEGSQSQGSRSYYSNEDGAEGSYVSGEDEGSFADEQ